ncbi:MAG: hypothetical protein Q9165_005429 [Trypethelium subeluteriae]
MAFRDLPFQCARSLRKSSAPRSFRFPYNVSRNASTTTHDQDLEPSSSLSIPAPSSDLVKDFDPAERARKRRADLGRELPPSRYRYRSPKYYRGPLHPHQPPPPSDPTSRQFIPGPFSLPRLEQTYHSTTEPDLMTLAYTHFPPGYRAPPKAPRLRSWDESSPYHKNRPLRAPRGHTVLPLLRPPITWQNVPRLERVTVHAMVREALEDKSHLHVARMVVQAITNVRVVTHRAKGNVVGWGLREGRQVSVSAEVTGGDMWDFVGKCVDVVLPRIKDWQGVGGRSGDSSGNIAWGLGPAEVALFPEVEVNYNM